MNPKHESTWAPQSQSQSQYHSATRNKRRPPRPLSPVSNASPSHRGYSPPSGTICPGTLPICHGSSAHARRLRRDSSRGSTGHLSFGRAMRSSRASVPAGVASAFTVHFLGADRRTLGRSAPAQRGGCSHPDIICPRWWFKVGCVGPTDRRVPSALLLFVLYLFLFLSCPVLFF